MTPQNLSRLARAGFLTGVTDGLFSSVLNVAFYHSTVTRLFQGVASVLLGPEALTGGTRTAAIGVLMHFGVAFGWSVVFLLLVMTSASLRTLGPPTVGPSTRLPWSNLPQTRTWSHLGRCSSDSRNDWVLH